MQKTSARTWRAFIASVVLLGAVSVAAWGLVPVGAVPQRQAWEALRDTTKALDLRIGGVEPLPHRPMPLSVALHPMRRKTSAPAPTDIRTGSASRYILHDPDDRTVICELHQREGMVVWIWLEGDPGTAPLIKQMQIALRRSLPWMPVSSPWK